LSMPSSSSVNASEWTTPPSIHRSSSSLPVLLLPLKYVFGSCFTVFLIALLIVISPFLLLYRLVKYIRDKLVLPISCDLLWPNPPFTRAFVWLSNQVSLDSIAAILNGQPPPEPVLCFHPTPISRVEVAPWDHQKAPLRNQDDLITYVKEKINHVPYAVQVKTITGYEDAALGRTVLAIKTHPDSYPLCMARIVSALSQGNVTIEVEPRVFYECNINPTRRFQCIRRAADKITKFIEMFAFGPFGLLFIMTPRPEKVWRALVAETHQVFTYHRRSSLLRGSDSETSRLCINSSVQLRPETSCSFSITEINGIEELQKVERLLRATIPELLTSFLAGALRRYFRTSDPPVLHPPDCMAALSVCTDKSSVCQSSSPCDHLLLPIHLPIGVEGRIPRLWCLQRELSELADRCTPQAMKAFKAVSRTLLTRHAHSRVSSLFHRHSVVNISFLRVHGDVMLDANLLTQFIPIPPLFLPTRAAFVFVQHHDRILLVSSIDRGLFDRHNDIFTYMQEEQDGLLAHLSFRLKTLTQTCVLPDRLPSEDAQYPAPPDAPQNSPSVDLDVRDDLPGPSRPRRQSMADLSDLLREVQEELDEMNRNPNVEDRDTTIRKLRQLEAKIEQFHNGIKSELWGNTVWLKKEKDEAMKKVAELLAPYQRRASVSTRKLSRRASREYAVLRRGSKDITTRRGSNGSKREGDENSRSQRNSSKDEETELELLDEEKRGERRGRRGGEEREEDMRVIEVRENDEEGEKKKKEEEEKKEEKGKEKEEEEAGPSGEHK
ncbi:hypothetical protein PFISCL1PPCAC_10267, partial [Pristionchus fissidentatus]